jgi:tetratricopeptide (TPR) repeat protein
VVLRRTLVCLLLGGLLQAGCAGSGREHLLLEADAPAVEMTEVPFFPQQDRQCGPAALATVLCSSGRETTPDELAPQLYLPGRRGSLQAEMIAAARRYGRIPLVLAPTPAAIGAELAAGRPVLVLQNLGVSWLPVWHYAVVIGQLEDGNVVLRSGTERRLVMDAARFLATWRRAESWAMVVLRPGELPARFDPQGYFTALAAFETTGQPEIARQGYEAALARWPKEPVALFGLANSLLALGLHEQAVTTYRRLLALEPGHAAAVNNQAEALSQLGCHREALDLLDRTLGEAGGGQFRSTLQQTRSEVGARLTSPGVDACRFPPVRP